jgi:Arc/MetJ-type ribon-helix-helix transcriptional regulator
MKHKKEYNSRTAFRLLSEQRQEIERLIKEGKFKNISQVIRAALREFLEKH